jgi:hypothetical protein
MTALRSSGIEMRRPFYLALLAESLGPGGQTLEGLSLVTEALDLAAATGEIFYEAELYRLRGELLLRKAAVESDSSFAAASRVRSADRDLTGKAEAEACFRRALEIARRQDARSLELRAALSLARLLRDRGQPAEGCRLLAERFDWFTEGWDTPDLKAARDFLGGVA